MKNQKSLKPIFKIGDTIRWNGYYFNGFKEGWDFDKAMKYVDNGGNFTDVTIDIYRSGENKIVDIEHQFNSWFYVLDNGKKISIKSSTISLVV